MSIAAQDKAVEVSAGGALTTVAKDSIDLHFVVGNIVAATDSAFIGQLNLSGLRYDPRFADGFLIGLTLTFDADTATVALQGQSQAIASTDYDTNSQTLFSFDDPFAATPTTFDTFTISGVPTQSLSLVTVDGSLNYKLTNIKTVVDNLPDTGALTSLTNQLTSIKSDTTDIDTIVGHLPDGGALTAISENINFVVNAVTSAQQFGTNTYTDDGGEQTIFEWNNSPNISTLDGIWLDLASLITTGTLKVYYKIDKTNYRLIRSYAFDASTDPDGFLVELPISIVDDFKITYTEGSDEGAARDIPYQFVLSNI